MGKIHDFLWQSSTPEFTMFDSVCVNKHVLKIYRFLALSIMVFIYIWGGSLKEPIIGFRFLTRWGIFYVTLYFLLICLCYVKYRDEKSPEKDNANPYALWKYANIICEIAFSLQILIPPFYWIFVYATDEKSHTPLGFWQTFAAHFITGLLIWIENILNKVRYVPRHVLVICSFSVVYMVINYIATTVMEKPVYPNIRYDGIATALTLLMAFVIGMFGFSLGLLLTKIKYGSLQQVNKDDFRSYSEDEEGKVAESFF